MDFLSIKHYLIMKKILLMALTVLLVSCTNNSKVTELIKKAEQGDAAAQLEYGRLLKTSGNGVEQDWQKAVEMLQRAAEQGNVQLRTMIRPFSGTSNLPNKVILMP